MAQALVGPCVLSPQFVSRLGEMPDDPGHGRLITEDQLEGIVAEPRVVLGTPADRATMLREVLRRLLKAFVLGLRARPGGRVLLSTQKRDLRPERATMTLGCPQDTVDSQL